MKQAFKIEIQYLNKYGELITKTEYQNNLQVAHLRLEALTSKLRVIKASVKPEFIRGEK